MKNLKAVVAMVLSGLFIVPSVYADGEESPANRRYLNEVFKQSHRTGNIVYSKNYNNTTRKVESLTMRVFEPKCDTEAKRALVIITPGGGFVKHDDHWMDAFGEQLARAGYVVAMNRYRLSEQPNSLETYLDAFFKGVVDQKAVIRYFVKDAQGANRYRIDPDKIFIGGHSAGAIISMHTGYIDAKDELIDAMKQAIANNGGLDGNDGRENVPYKIRGVINMSGLVVDLNIFDSGEPPLMNIHGDKDQVVQIDGRESGLLGSIPIHERATSVGLVDELHIIRGGLHNDTSMPELCPECVPLVKRFMFDVMKTQ